MLRTPLDCPQTAASDTSPAVHLLSVEVSLLNWAGERVLLSPPVEIMLSAATLWDFIESCEDVLFKGTFRSKCVFLLLAVQIILFNQKNNFFNLSGN